MDLTEDLIPKLYNEYKPKRELYDSWIIEVRSTRVVHAFTTP
jgi:hypothetical protein